MKPKSLRAAAVFNTVWPGTGQMYLGQFRLGAALAFGFGACFLAAVGIFINGMRLYFEMASDGKILEGDHLERLNDALHKNWLIGLMIAGVVIYAASLAALQFAPPAAEENPTVPPPAIPPLLPPAPPA